MGKIDIETIKEDIRKVLISMLEKEIDVEFVPIELKKFGTVSYVDEKIADGCDDGEDTYVIMRSYDVYPNGQRPSIYIRIYFGNSTRYIGYFSVN